MRKIQSTFASQKMEDTKRWGMWVASRDERLLTVSKKMELSATSSQVEFSQKYKWAQKWIFFFFLQSPQIRIGASLVAQRLKRLPAMKETWVRSLGWEDPLEKEMATHSSILAWRIPWTEEPGGLQSTGSPRVRHDWVTSLSFFLSDKN